MEPSIDKIHHLLLETALPSTIEDLKTLKEDYVVNLLITFLSRFNIDMSIIDQPFMEQYTVMTYYEDSDIINLINLYTVVAQILDKIFVPDFCLTDITSPGQKRFRKHAKFLTNFMLYAMYKKSEFNEKMDQVHAASRLLEELKEKKDKVLESINNKKLHKTKQLSLIKKLENDIQHMQLKTEKMNKKELELEIMKGDVERENLNAKELCNSIRTTAGKMSKVIAELQSEIVNLPEEYQLRLKELEEQKNQKVEERDVMQEAIQDKKHSIKQIEEKLNFVQKMIHELPTLKDTYKELKDYKTQSYNILKQIDTVKDTWNELQTKLAMHKDQVDTEINELQSHREEDIAPLINLYNQLLSVEKAQKAKLDATKACFNEKSMEKNQLQTTINRKEEETMVFLQSCQEMYDNEIADELELLKAWNEE